jgi:hypothetical protein
MYKINAKKMLGHPLIPAVHLHHQAILLPVPKLTAEALTNAINH